jgi:ferritin-like protein
MDLWKTVEEVLGDYYSEFGRANIHEPKSQEIFQKIMEKARKNLNFRKKLISSPVKTLAQQGFKLPKGFSVKFIEETKDTIFIPIPPYVGDKTPKESK